MFRSVDISHHDVSRELAEWRDVRRDGLLSTRLDPNEAAMVAMVVAPMDRDTELIKLGRFTRGDAGAHFADHLRPLSGWPIGPGTRRTWTTLQRKASRWTELQAMSVMAALQQYREVADPAAGSVDVSALVEVGLLDSSRNSAPDAELVEELASALRRVAVLWDRLLR